MRREYVVNFGHPKCSTQEQFDLWLTPSPGQKRLPLPKFGFCTDCRPFYKFKMLALGRCEHPEIKFRDDEDGLLEGYGPPPERVRT